MKVGAYFYPWYGRQRWQEARFPSKPLIGEYSSPDPLAIDWQISQMKRAGLDFVAIELISPSDWSSAICYETIERMLPRLRSAGIGWTFLIDNKLGPPNELAPRRPWRYDGYDEIMTLLRERHWGENLIEGPGGKPILFGFSPELGEAIYLEESFPQFEWLFPVYLPYWSLEPTSWHQAEIGRTRYSKLLSEPGQTVFKLYTTMRYVAFWCEHNQFLVANGVGSIIPGYDDSLLGRPNPIAPYVARGRGEKLVEQFGAVVAGAADMLLVYSWNEYFEATTIEPSIQDGDFYVRLLGHLVAQAKVGEPVTLPADFGEPQAQLPVYLSAELKVAAEAYPDRLPRWDQDDYRAHVKGSGPALTRPGDALFPQILVSNVGLEPWVVQRGFRLGVRAYNSAGEVVREGRAELPGGDVRPGDSRTTDIRLETGGLAAGRYRCDVGVVLEGSFWFDRPVRFEIEISGH